MAQDLVGGIVCHTLGASMGVRQGVVTHRHQRGVEGHPEMVSVPTDPPWQKKNRICTPRAPLLLDDPPAPMVRDRPWQTGGLMDRCIARTFLTAGGVRKSARRGGSRSEHNELNTLILLHQYFFESPHTFIPVFSRVVYTIRHSSSLVDVQCAIYICVCVCRCTSL